MPTDNFTRANAATLGANWTDIVAGFAIASDLASNSTGGTGAVIASKYSATTPSANHSSQLTYVTQGASSSNQPGVCVRLSGTNAGNMTAYWLFLNTHTGTDDAGWSLQYGNSFTVIDSGTTALSNNDLWKISVSGTSISITQNGSLIGASPYTDSHIATGTWGMCGYQTGGATTQSTWIGVDLVTGYTLSASYGPFSITGEAASLSAYTSIPNLLAACGLYNISLASASSDFDLISAFGTYGYIGIAASLVPVISPVSLAAAFGTYSIAAQNALLVFAQPPPPPAGLNIVPLMVGIFYEEAVYLLEQLNIYSPPTILSISQTPTVSVKFVASNQIAGIVLAQSLAVGTAAPLGTPVTLTVSQYPMAQDVRP